MTTDDPFGYSRSDHFIQPERFDRLPAGELSFALRRALAECKRLADGEGSTRFKGAYVLQERPDAPAVPVVYLVSAESEEVARKIHQFVWNQNQTPFLILESPKAIRLYSGFAYDRESDQPLKEVVRGLAQQLESLAAFRAESIDDGTIWQHWGHAVDPKQRVDERLLADLRVLDRQLQEAGGLQREASHGLIGRYVYLRYLHDRGILSDRKLDKWGIDRVHLFTRRATLTAFRRVNKELQEWLNGSVFSLDAEALAEITPQQLQLVAGVFSGDSPKGVSGVQHALFDVYDFSHIPIETLSCVYEQFLHDQGSSDVGKKGTASASRGKQLAAYYTPPPLADYVLSEMDRKRPLKPGMKVLDPACGSGAFLVQCYRRLIERQRRVIKRELKASELRDLLTQHVFGIDRDDDACRISELSLIMTLLDYVNPPDLESTNFKLPSLRNQNIFEGDFFGTQGPVFDLLSEARFDWVVGNPPWAEVKKTPPPEHVHFAVHQWMKSQSKSHPTSGNQLAEAFLWKSGEHLSPDGACALVVPAMTWFKKEATRFRQVFFATRRVWCLANFANLAYVLFAGRSERPASVVFFESASPGEDDVISTFSPFVADQIANRAGSKRKTLDTWNIVVSAADLQEVRQSSASSGEALTWKLAMWGTSRDRKLLERLQARFREACIVSLKRYGISEPSQGLELRDASASEEIEHHPELIGKKLLVMGSFRGSERLFSFTDEHVGLITEDNCYLRIRGGRAGLGVSYPPHVIVDASRRFAVFSDEFIAVPPIQIGISGSRESTLHLRAISLFLSSDFCIYHQFLNSLQWGVDANRAGLKTLYRLPIPIGQLSPTDLANWSNLLDELIATTSARKQLIGYKEKEPAVSALIADLNDRVYSLLGLRKAERWLVEDFVRHHLELNKGKFTAEASQAPNEAEQLLYLRSLRDCLDGFFTSDRGVRHKIEVLVDGESAMLAVSLVKSKCSVDPIVIPADAPASRDLKVIRDRLRSKHSQWVYFDRRLKAYDRERGVLYQFKPLQRLQWTRRQAVLDADEIIAETLAEGGDE